MKASPSKNWMKGAVKRKGEFKKKAEEAGMDTSEYASKVLKKDSKASKLTKKQAVLAKTFAKYRKK